MAKVDCHSFEALAYRSLRLVVEPGVHQSIERGVALAGVLVAYKAHEKVLRVVGGLKGVEV